MDGDWGAGGELRRCRKVLLRCGQQEGGCRGWGGECLDDEGEGSYENSVVAIGQERGDSIEVVLKKVGALAHDAQQSQHRLLAYVRVAVPQQLLHLRACVRVCLCVQPRMLVCQPTTQ